MPNTTGKHHHQNNFAFRHNKHSKLTVKIQALPEYNICQRCSDIIEWRKKYRKYKVQKDATRCCYCHQRKVKLAYHSACDECCTARKVCAKCLHSTEQVGELVEQKQKKLTGDELAAIIDSAAASERYRRKCRRLYEKGERDADEVVEMLANYGLRKEKAGVDDIEDELDFDSASDDDSDPPADTAQKPAASSGSSTLAESQPAEHDTASMSSLVEQLHVDPSRSTTATHSSASDPDDSSDEDEHLLGTG